MKWNFLEHWDLVTDMRSWAEQDVKIPPLTYCMVVKIMCKMYRYLKMKLVGKSQEELSVLVLFLYQQKFRVYFSLSFGMTIWSCWMVGNWSSSLWQCKMELVWWAYFTEQCISCSVSQVAFCTWWFGLKIQLMR